MEIRIPGAVWEDYLSSAVSTMEDELGLGDPKAVKRGRGFQMVYANVSPSIARELADYLGDRGWTLLGMDEDGSVHRRAIEIAKEIRTKLS